MKLFKNSYNSFEDKELGYYLRRKPSLFRIDYPIRRDKKKSQENFSGFTVVVKIKKGNRKPKTSVRGRKNRNLVKRPPGLSLREISRNRCIREYGFKDSIVTKGYQVYRDGAHNWYEFSVTKC